MQTSENGVRRFGARSDCARGPIQPSASRIPATQHRPRRDGPNTRNRGGKRTEKRRAREESDAQISRESRVRLPGSERCSAASERDGRVGAHSASVDNRQPELAQWERDFPRTQRDREEDKGIMIIVVADTEPNTMTEGNTIRSF